MGRDSSGRSWGNCNQTNQEWVKLETIFEAFKDYLERFSKIGMSPPKRIFELILNFTDLQIVRVDDLYNWKDVQFDKIEKLQFEIKLKDEKIASMQKQIDELLCTNSSKKQHFSQKSIVEHTIADFEKKFEEKRKELNEPLKNNRSNIIEWNDKDE